MEEQKVPWLERQLRYITIGDDAKDIIQIGGGIFANARPWSLLKLASLRYLGAVYTRIMRSCIAKGYFNKMYYVDSFSGPGINKIESSEVFCLGSPLIINAFDKERQFNKLFLNDENKTNRNALDARLSKTAKTEYMVAEEDANSFIENILPEISERKCHSLIFIDPYSTQFSWQSMEKVLELNADLFFLFQTSQMPRAIPVVTRPDARIRGFFKNYDEIEEIFEDDSVDDKPQAFFDIYKRDVLLSRGLETPTESIRIGKGNFYYDMLFVTNKTRGGNPWFKAVMDLKQRIEECDSTYVERLLQVISGRQAKISNWF